MRRALAASKKSFFSASITFKTAAIIVVACHLLGFFALHNYSSFRAKLAKKKYNEEKISNLVKTNNSRLNWPNYNASKLVVAFPVAKEKKKEKPPLLTKPNPVKTPSTTAKKQQFSKQVTANKGRSEISISAPTKPIYNKTAILKSIPAPLKGSQRIIETSEIVSRRVVGSYIIIK